MSEQTKVEEKKLECMGRWPHHFLWVWENGKMTDVARCATCTEERWFKKKGGDGLVVRPGLEGEPK